MKRTLFSLAVLGVFLLSTSAVQAVQNTPPELKSGPPVNWSLIKTDGFNPKRPGCYEQLHKVYLQAGVNYTIDMKSTAFDAYLFLEASGTGQSGKVLAKNDDDGGGTNAKIVYTPTTTGYCYVVATTFTKGAIGNYMLTMSTSGVQPPNPNTPPELKSTTPVNWSLFKTDGFSPKRPGCYEQLHKAYLKAGTTYTIDMKSTDFDAYLFLEASGPGQSGKVLAQNDDGGGNLNAKIVYTPTTTGYCYVVATTFTKGATGDYVLTISP